MQRFPSLLAIALPLFVPACGGEDPAETGDTGSESGDDDDDDASMSMSASNTSPTDPTETDDTADDSDGTDTSDGGSSESSGSTDEGSTDGSDSSSTGTEVGYELLDPGLEHFGATYEEWAAAWWQWMYGLPATNHPVLDPDGTYCGAGQSGPVFHLAGDFGGPPLVRICTIPADTAVWLPVVNATWDNAGLPEEDWYTEEELQAGATAFIDGIDDFSLEIDGDVYDMTVLGDFRIDPYQSTYEVPEEDSLYDLFGYPVPVAGTVDPTFGDGVYAMIEFAAGEHEIRIYATESGDPETDEDDFTIDVTYMLTVE